MGLMRRSRAALSLAVALALAAVLSLCGLSAQAEGLRFTLRVSVDADAAPPSARSLAESLAPLAEASVLSGTLARQGESFDLHLTLALGDNEDARADVRLYGLPSHWGVTSPLLGDEALMVNHLAWMEFAVKAHNHLDLPLRPLFLLSSPYAHTSALAGAGALCAEALGLNDTPRSVSPEALRALAEDLAALPEADRALYYWVAALGMESGADELIFSALEALPDYVAAHFPEGLTVEETETALRWKSDGAAVLSFERTGEAQAVKLALPELLEVHADVQARGDSLSGNVKVACAAVTMDAAFCFPTALPVVEPFGLTVDASGPLAGDAGVHLRLAGEPTADGVIVRQYFPAQAQPLWTAEADLAAAEVDCPVYLPEDIVGVNVLSVTGPTLNALLAEAAEPMVKGAFPLLVEAPAVSCQALMDVLEARGILPLLLEGIAP